MRKSSKNHEIPDELEEKILACYGHVTARCTAEMLGIKKSKVYTTLLKFKKEVGKKATRYPLDETKRVKKRLKRDAFKVEKRLTKPFKTSQLG